MIAVLLVFALPPGKLEEFSPASAVTSEVSVVLVNFLAVTKPFFASTAECACFRPRNCVAVENRISFVASFRDEKLWRLVLLDIILTN